jgi:hypothetical protein
MANVGAATNKPNAMAIGNIRIVVLLFGGCSPKKLIEATSIAKSTKTDIPVCL